MKSKIWRVRERDGSLAHTLGDLGGSPLSSLLDFVGFLNLENLSPTRDFNKSEILFWVVLNRTI